ncbi:MAG: hypothetical protein DRR19_05240 [Candidatus Parabeggiatoa sp. nov. 1]|nr:MAG: hypothetical protein DRR19_05240 [Gammaproteobacteria bacterium]
MCFYCPDGVTYFGGQQLWWATSRRLVGNKKTLGGYDCHGQDVWWATKRRLVGNKKTFGGQQKDVGWLRLSWSRRLVGNKKTLGGYDIKLKSHSVRFIMEQSFGEKN